MNISFEGQRILVTGAGQGIGRDLCIALAKAGAKVVAVSRTAIHLETLKKEQPGVEIIPLDVRDWTKTRQVLSNIGVVHALVNNAAVAMLEGFFDITEEGVDASLDINVKAVINISQIIAKSMVENKIAGNIVNISSQASLRGLRNHAVYCATKGAMDAFTRAMVLELGPHNIRVNCVNPTVVMTAMGELGWADPKKAESMISRIPLRRFAQVEDVVNAVIFLLSDKSGMVNGALLPIEGGFWAG